MRVWRICSRRHAAFDGEGARRFGGRWNHRGTAIVYTSESLSLAALEYFVNLDSDLAPSGLVFISVEIPDGVAMERLEIADLPKDWRLYPAPETLQDQGTAWVAKASSVVLAVPSVVIPEERNYLLNPAHPDFKRIVISPSKPFHFDPRMRK